mmetsp:Transcript_14546/g.25105  ORF Transcript_14546/g.25105 Transcript_14546/m.25105 type:complete len:95 (+) Transcript_14546:1249-1533(+)
MARLQASDSSRGTSIITRRLVALAMELDADMIAKRWCYPCRSNLVVQTIVIRIGELSVLNIVVSKGLSKLSKRVHTYRRTCHGAVELENVVLVL